MNPINFNSNEEEILNTPSEIISYKASPDEEYEETSDTAESDKDKHYGE